METVTLYREIGKTLHSLGAFRVVLLNSKASPKEDVEMFLEIAVDGEIDIKEASETCLKKFTSVKIKLIDLNEFIMSEVIEDGIKI